MTNSLKNLRVKTTLRILRQQKEGKLWSTSDTSVPDLKLLRKKTLQLLQKTTIEFVKVVLTKKNKPQSTINAAGGKIFTFGSYRLGVYGPGTCWQ